MKNELVSLQKRAEAAEQALQLEREARASEKIPWTSRRRLHLRSSVSSGHELHHLRRVTTERHLALANEKQVLLTEMERLVTGTSQHGDDIAGHFRLQLEEVENAAQKRESAMKEEIEVLRKDLAKQRRMNEVRERQHAEQLADVRREVELSQESNVKELESSVREKSDAKETVATMRSRTAIIEKEALEVRRNARKEVETLRSASAKREQELQKQILNLEASRQALREELLSGAPPPRGPRSRSGTKTWL